MHAHVILVGLGPELYLSQDLVGEGVAHDKARVSCGTAKVHQSPLGKEDDAVSTGELVAINLWEEEKDSTLYSM